jgi:catechol 2,3-dioxygenase-like lactoylglutathione lyase family enzyme
MTPLRLVLAPLPPNGVHAAFKTESRAKVDAFYKAALEQGGTDEGPPGFRSHYHPNYDGAYVRDPDWQQATSGLSS